LDRTDPRGLTVADAAPRPADPPPSGALHRTLVDRVTAIRGWHWLLAAGAILVLDYLTGPFIQFPILFVLPVAMATAAHGPGVGAMVAVVLPLFRLGFFLRWEVRSGWLLEGIDAGTDMVILVGFALLVDRILRQQREIQILQGLLPICSFCKRIREEGGEWRQLETYIADRSAARFSHTFCEECGRRHYPDLVE
jgi:hypothetical protein